MKEYCIALTTFESEAQAQPVIDIVLAEKLAACVQVMPIRSHYVWKGEICHDPEVLVLCKTASRRYPELERRLRELHPYETPEIIAVDIAHGFSGYLDWIDDMTGE